MGSEYDNTLEIILNEIRSANKEKKNVRQNDSAGTLGTEERPEGSSGGSGADRSVA